MVRSDQMQQEHQSNRKSFIFYVSQRLLAMRSLAVHPGQWGHQNKAEIQATSW